MILRIVILWLGIVCACGAQPETVEKDGVRYFVWKAAPGKVRVVWKDDAGKQLRDFPAAKAYLEEKGEKPAMLMNGGIFEPGGVPSGVMVQEGKELHAVNRRDGDGNFFLSRMGFS